MSSWMDQLSFFLCGATLLLTALGLGLAVVMPGIDRWSKRFFIILFSVLLLYAGACLVDTMIYRNPAMATAERIVIYIESLFPLIFLPMLTVYILHCSGESWRGSPLFRAVSALCAFTYVLLVIAQFTYQIYYITPENYIVRGPWFVPSLFPEITILLLDLAGVIRRRDRLSRKVYHGFLIYLLPLTAAVLVHIFVPVYALIGICIGLFALLMYGIILSDQIEQYTRQQREIAQQRASITVLQMRPHFIYNTMMSIYYLCRQDSEKAQQVTLDFTTYLRKNFTAIASEDVIPFSDELEHARAYLAVEQAQFEDNLFVEFDTPHTRFRLPPLTLQPIVENAVKHGMDPDSEPLRISIRTRETNAGSEIVVEDNGPGYEPTDDHEPHIALNNIRERLEMMCGGKLEIAPRKDGGTTVRILIP